MPLWPRDIHPSTVVNNTHQGALATIAAAFCLACSLLFFVARLLLRWPWTALFRIDDAIVAAATAIALVQVAVVISAVKDGLGTASSLLSATALVKVEQKLYASNIPYVLSLYIGKASVAALFLRLSGAKSQKLDSRTIAIVCGVFCVVSVFVVAIEPGAASPWQSERLGINAVTARWIAVEAMASITEILFAIFPVRLVRGLQMHTNTKLEVVIGVWARLPLIVIAILRLVSLWRVQHRPDFVFHYVWPEIYLQIEVSYNLISAMIPSLRSFLRKAKSGMLGEMPESVSEGTRMATICSSSYGRMYSKRKRGIQPNGRDMELTVMTPARTITEAAPGDNHSIASDSSQRTIVVRKTVNIEYQENVPPQDLG